MYRLGEMKGSIGEQEQVSPGEEMLAVHAEAKNRIGTPPDEELLNSLLRRNLLEWFLRVDDGERNKNRTRPRRNLVDIEVEPIGKENDLRRDRRNSIVIVLA